MRCVMIMRNEYDHADAVYDGQWLVDDGWVDADKRMMANVAYD